VTFGLVVGLGFPLAILLWGVQMGSLTEVSLMVRCGAHLSKLALGSFILSLRLVEVNSVHKEFGLEVKRGLFATSDVEEVSVGC
jgi:hypothetical protein